MCMMSSTPVRLNSPCNQFSKQKIPMLFGTLGRIDLGTPQVDVAWKSSWEPNSANHHFFESFLAVRLQQNKSKCKSPALAADQCAALFARQRRVILALVGGLVFHFVVGGREGRCLSLLRKTILRQLSLRDSSVAGIKNTFNKRMSAFGGGIAAGCARLAFHLIRVQRFPFYSIQSQEKNTFLQEESTLLIPARSGAVGVLVN